MSARIAAARERRVVRKLRRSSAAAATSREGHRPLRSASTHMTVTKLNVTIRSWA